MDFLPVNRPVGTAALPSLYQTIMNNTAKARVATPSQDTAPPLPPARSNAGFTGNTASPTEQQRELDKIALVAPGGSAREMQAAVEAKLAQTDDIARAISENFAEKSQRDRWIRVLTEVFGKPGQPTNVGTAETMSQFKSGSVGAPI